MSVEHETSGGEAVATLEAIFDYARKANIEDEEIDEALNHLLTMGLLMEVDDDCFVIMNR